MIVCDFYLHYLYVWSVYCSTGRAYVYGSGVLDRKSFPFDIRMKTGDVLGMGWMRQVGTPSVGTLFVTLNGNKLESQIDNVQANLWPIVHLQKKVSLFV